MEIDKPCEYCNQKMAVTNCELCGSAICAECKLENGCKVCGGEKTV
ncbi:MAG: hypothetical protein H8Z69_03080 [Nanohaloarchaea archaeon]|nr:hypothetical protein [Candidatus Nanohaloarchaea archaeon]